MPYDQIIKDRAYAIDPECWVSYGGKPKGFKQVMEVRRKASIEKALAMDHPGPEPSAPEYRRSLAQATLVGMFHVESGISDPQRLNDALEEWFEAFLTEKGLS